MAMACTSEGTLYCSTRCEGMAMATSCEGTLYCSARCECVIMTRKIFSYLFLM
nr:MAG TPA: hypothetical protein [Bacteriophage sp.]